MSKISNLPSVSSFDGTEQVVMVKAGATRRGPLVGLVSQAAEPYVAQAQHSAAMAATAAEAAAVNRPIYADAAAGMQATAMGAFFFTPGSDGDFLVLWRHGSVAEEIGRSPSIAITAALNAARNDAVEAAAAAHEALDGIAAGSHISTVYNLDEATEGQTVWVLPFAPTLAPVVYLAGALLRQSDFGIAGNILTLTEPAIAGATMSVIPNQVAMEMAFTHAAAYLRGTALEKLKQDVNPLDQPYFAIGSGAANDRAALIDADVDGPLTITANHYIATSMIFTKRVRFVGNGRLTIAASAVVTFADGVAAGPDKRIFFGAGTVAGIKDFCLEWITAKDDATDDTVNIQKAIDCIGSIGSIRHGPGIWKMTAAVHVPSGGVKFNGAGSGASIFKQYTATSNVFEVSGGFFGATGFSVRFVDQGAGSAGGKAFSFDACSYSRLRDIYIYRARVGVEYINRANSHFAHLVNIEDPSENGVIVLHANNVLWSQCQILCEEAPVYATNGCIRIYGSSEGCNFTDIQTYRGVLSITTDAPSFTFGQIPAYNKFTNCYFDGAHTSIINNSAEFDFVNCWFSCRPDNGIYISNSDGMRFNGGQAINCGKSGILVDNTVKRFSAKGFSARSNSVSAPNTYSGITVTAGTTDFEIECSGTNALLNFGTQKYVVEVQNGASDRYDLLVYGAAHDGGTGTNKSVRIRV